MDKNAPGKSFPGLKGKEIVRFGSNQNKRMSTKGFLQGERLELVMPQAFAERISAFDWPEECYAGNWVIDSDGQYQTRYGNIHCAIPSVPKSWERIYN